jgi:hypothetical protein
MIVERLAVKNCDSKVRKEEKKEIRGHYVYLTKPGYKPGQAGVMDFLELWWYRFELQSNIYMLDATEKAVICTTFDSLILFSVDFLLVSVMLFAWYSSIKFIQSMWL